MPFVSRDVRGSIVAVALAVLCVLVMAVPLACQIPSSAPGGEADTAQADTAAVAEADSVCEETEIPTNPEIRITLKKGGEIVIELLPDMAPRAVERILMLVREGFYNDLRFHRVEPYLVQTGRGESELPPIEGEMFGQNCPHKIGMVGMARRPDDYDSATTQFYIMKKGHPPFNGEYTLFGCVIEGMDHVQRIKKGWKIKEIAISSETE